MILDLITPSSTFLEDVERLVQNSKLSYLDAIVHWCETKNLDIDYVASLVAGNLILKSKLQNEAENLNFIPRSIRLAI